MKRMIAVVLCTLLLTGCAAPATAPTPTPEAGTSVPAAIPTTVPTPTPEPTEPPLLIDINVPAVVFEGEDMEEIVKAGKENGFTKVSPNEDGSVTYTMTQARYEKWKDECRGSVIASLDGLSADYPTIKRIEYNKDLTEIRITADGEDWDLMQSTSIFIAGTAAQFYFRLTGQALTATVTAVDEATGEVLNTGTYSQEG